MLLPSDFELPNFFLTYSLQLNHAIDIVHAELLPHEKAMIIENFKKDGPTAMIGDGINDAPALATADIGISMGISGSALANETGNAILMSNDIRKVPEAIRLARRTKRKLIENVIIAIGSKSAIMALAIAGYPLVWLAVLTDVGTCLLVILNSMLLLQEKPKYEKESTRSKYGSNFLEDKTKPLLDKQSNDSNNVVDENKCGKECCENLTHHVGATNASKDETFGLKKLRLFKGKGHGSFVFVEVHIVKPSNGCCCLDKVKMCCDGDSSSCNRTNNGSDDCGTGSVRRTQDAGHNKDKSVAISELSGTSGIPQCCKKGCCNDPVIDNNICSLRQPEIIIE